MELLNGKLSKQSMVKQFYTRHPGFNPRQSLILHHRPAQRWFDLLKYGDETDLYNFQEVMQGKAGSEVIIRDRSLYMMSSYDYLGLIGHPEIEAASIDAIREFGTGSGGVRLLTGTNELHCQLENKISCIKGTESAMVLSSGYMANLAAIAGLFGRNDLVIADESIHYSIADAIRVAGVPHVYFRHNDVSFLKKLLEENVGIKRKLIVIEGVYSMDGDICSLPEIVQLKEEYGAFLMIDEAHSFGVLGASGRGVNEFYGTDASRIDIFTGSLSKAIPANGGFIAAKEEVIIYLKHGGAPFMFSAALSPANTAAALKSLEVLDTESWRLGNLWKNTRQMMSGLSNAGINTGHSQSPVIPVICGQNEKAFALSKKLFDMGFLANAVVYPAVPVSSARLRLCCTAAQYTEVIGKFVDAVEETFDFL